ncbi:hypothetical protein LB506_007112 [Fusarium annulatum]|nr:hypothetical protein LB506_007112 [Fusarium annulatum]
MVADINLYPGLRGYMRTILCHHVVALRMSQDVSRYPRERAHWSNMETEEIKREGQFYYRVGLFLKENLAYADKFKDQRTMAKIAKS